jgi:peptidoglycan/LPS O-acetylase OafA/YrhL
VRRVGYIPTLDGWRAIAISLVLGAHSIGALLATGTFAGNFLAMVFEHVSFGVDIFFALSGYLICTLLLNERERNGYLSLSKFYIRRAFRILPPILVYLLVLAILVQWKLLPTIPAWDFLAVLAFIRNYVGVSLYTGHFWSLAVEEHFYMFVPLLLSRLNWRGALTAATGLAVACGVVRAAEYRWLNAITPIHFRTESRLDALMYGAALAILLQRKEIRAWISRALSPISMLAVAGATSLALSTLASPAARRSVIALVLPLFVISTVLRPDSVAGRLLELNWVRWLGRLSYSLYIWQELFLVHDGEPLGFMQRYPGCLMMSLMSAVVSYYLIEKPAIRMGHRIAGGGNPTFPSSERPEGAQPETVQDSLLERTRLADPTHIH